MCQFELTCCSTADMTADFFKKNKIPFACFSFTMGGVEYEDDYGKSMSIDTFYERIAAGEEAVTSQVNAEKYRAIFEPILKKGKDIVHITLSSGITSTYNSAIIAKNMMEEEYPGRTVHIIDSYGASSGYGLLVTYACELRDAGKSAEEVKKWVEDNKLRVHHWFFSTDLTTFLRGGRISATSAWFGTALHICPLMNMDNIGRLIPRFKIRGKKKVKQEIIKKMEMFADNGTDYNEKCYISHSACLNDAEDVRDLVEKKFPNLKGKVLINNVGTVIGSHTGTGTVALFFLGKVRED
jgi:DegV family protein with EDD domain